MIERRHYDRVMAHADRDAMTGCLVSRYSAGSHGYAQAWDGSRNVLAHRLVWEFVNGPIPEGKTVDHRQGLCHRKCIEITHLRLLDTLDNSRRNQGLDFPLGWSCRRNHPASAMIRLARKTKTGERRWSWTCGACMEESRQRYRERH